MPRSSSARPESGTQPRLTLVDEGYGEYDSAFVDWLRDLGRAWGGDGSEILLVAGIIDLPTVDGTAEAWQATAVARVLGFVTEYTYTHVPSRDEDKRVWGPLSTGPAFGRRIAAARKHYIDAGARQVIERHYGRQQPYANESQA